MNYTIPRFSVSVPPPPLPGLSLPDRVTVIQRWLTTDLYPNLVNYMDLVQNQLNTGSQAIGGDIASAATINVSAWMHNVTGTVTISTVNAPKGFASSLMLISQDGFSLGTGGNLQISAQTVVPAGTYAHLTYNPNISKWHVDASFALITAGAGISVSGSGGSVMVSNTGVLSVAGTANQIVVSAATGNVVFSLPTLVAIMSLQLTAQANDMQMNSHKVQGLAAGNSANDSLAFAQSGAKLTGLDLSGGDLRFGVAQVAISGGTLATLGGITGGPSTAAQNSWQRVLLSDGSTAWLAVWK